MEWWLWLLTGFLIGFIIPVVACGGIGFYMWKRPQTIVRFVMSRMNR